MKLRANPKRVPFSTVGVYSAQLRPPAARWTGMKYFFLGLLVTGSGLLSSAASYRAGPWSVEVSVVADQPAIMLGEPTWLSFTVKNLSEENLQLLVGGDDQNALGRPDSFQVK